MGQKAHAQEQVARRTAADARPALAGEPDALAVADAARDGDLVVAPVAERDPAPAAGRRLLERELDDRLPVAAAATEAALEAAGAPAASERPRVRPPNRPSKKSLKSSPPKSPPPKSTRTLPKPSKPSKPDAPETSWPAFQFASEPVVALALLGVAQHLVGLGDLLEAVLGARRPC